MEIRQEIGSRISASRKELGITIKELSKRTEELSAARISNYEQGTRSPGPMEAKALAKALQVSASYLLCLTDDPRGEVAHKTNMLPTYAPVLTMNEAHTGKQKTQATTNRLALLSNEIEKITLEDKTGAIAGENAFAVRVNDSSMHPTFCEGDIVIIDPDRQPNPGQLIIAHVKSSKQNLLRKFRECEDDAGKICFELIPLNPDWRTLVLSNEIETTIVGTVIEHRRYL